MLCRICGVSLTDQIDISSLLISDFKFLWQDVDKFYGMLIFKTSLRNVGRLKYQYSITQFNEIELDRIMFMVKRCPANPAIKKSTI